MLPAETAPILRYDRLSIWLHWATALLVVFQWVGAHLIDEFPPGPQRRAMLGLHITAGCALVGILAWRLLWRWRGATRPPPAQGGLAGLAAQGVHLLLYALLAATLGCGLWLLWVRGDNIFGMLQVPAFDPGNRALRRETKDLHETLANALLILAGLHAAAGIAHHLLLRDGVLRRMWPAGGRA
jgi:cytochrome b561